MAVSFKKAVREKVYAKVLLTGPSGSGKSMSALKMATGLYRKCGGEGIAYIGSEGDRDRLYAKSNNGHGFDYDLLQISEPFTPEKYIEAIDAAIDAGYKICIIDSITQAWTYLNDEHSKMGGNSFTNWSRLKPRHRAMVQKILTSPMHILITARGKDEWILEEKNGKQVPKKAGVGAVTDKDISYEVMLSLQIDQDTHIAHADKDNTRLFDGKYEIITEKHGEMLYDWCESGDVAEPKPTPAFTSTPPTSEEDDLKSIKSEIITLCVAKGGQKNETLMKTIKAFVPSGNPNAIKSLDTAKNCLEAVKALD